MRRELLGKVHPDVAQTLSELARVIDEQGDVRRATDTQRESLEIYQKLFPGDNPDVARAMNVLGYRVFTPCDGAVIVADRFGLRSLRVELGFL